MTLNTSHVASGDLDEVEVVRRLCLGGHRDAVQVGELAALGPVRVQVVGHGEQSRRLGVAQGLQALVLLGSQALDMLLQARVGWLRTCHPVAWLDATVHLDGVVRNPMTAVLGLTAARHAEDAGDAALYDLVRRPDVVMALLECRASSHLVGP